MEKIKCIGVVIIFIKNISWQCELEIDYVMSLDQSIGIDIPNLEIQYPNIEEQF